MNESSGILSSLKNLNFSKILGTANRTLNFVNKAIPMYKELGPTIGNLRKTFSKNNPSEIAKDEIKETRPINIQKNISTPSNDERNISNDTLTFFQ